MDTNRNFFIAIALSVVILTVWQVLYVNPRIEAEREAARIEAQQREATQPATSGAPDATRPPAQGALPGAEAPAAAPTGQARDGAAGTVQRVRIETPRLTGSISLRGARLDDLVLKDYRVSVEPGSPNVELLNPASQPDGFFAEIGFVANATTGQVPGPQTVWSVEGEPLLSPDQPVTLTFTNEKGLTFRRTIAVDRNYMFTVTDTVENAAGEAVELSAYGRVTRTHKPVVEGIFVLHEGLIGVTGEEGLTEIDYSQIEEEDRILPSKSEDGWLGITDKYWAVVLVPGSGRSFQPAYRYAAQPSVSYQADFLADPVSLAQGGTASFETRIFAGAKEVHTIDAYEKAQGIRQFDLLIDWGWFYFITKPMFYLIDWLYRLLGNFGLAILATTVVVKLVFFPLANKSYKSMANMKKVQPAMMEIREKYADDKMKMQQAMMELYKKEKINPLAGCWPILIQIPVFFALYKVLYVTIEMRHAPFFGWIKDLSAPDPTSIFNLFGLLPYDVPSFLLIGVWPIIMGITMFLQMRMNPTPPDPTQAMIFNWMPVVFTFMLATFPAGLVIYWAWNNFLSIIQQAVIMKRQGARIELWDNLVGLFRKKPTPAE
jgi:YidC/Oxa1 family membrane protein insertase